MQKRRQTIRQTKKWYVLIHLEPELIERHLQWENEERRQKGLRLFEYFIPYQFLPKAVPDQYAKDAESQNRYADDTNDLRKTLRQFVFIKASPNEVSRLVHQPWNREGRLHLHFYVSRNGHRITMPDPMMESFVTLCCENRQRFTFGPPIENVDEFDTVVIATGVFKDTEARILDVQDTSHGISITLGIPFFNGEKMLTLTDFKLSDVHLPHTVESLLNEHFISNVETGKQSMNIRKLLLISDALNVSTDWLLRNNTSTSIAISAEELTKELESCTPKEREILLKLVQTIKDSIQQLRATSDK